MGRLGRALSLKKKLGRPHERASANKNRNTSVKTHQERKEEKNQLQAVRDLEQSLLETGKAKRVAAAKRRAAKKARKEENEIKSGHYQVIKDTEKIRRWHKKAKRDLVKMSEEQMKMIAQRR